MRFDIIKRLLIFMLLMLTAIDFAYSKGASDKKFTVVIDAGHGGKDIGAADNGVTEKNINLKVARQLEALIKKHLKNTNVVMTRDGDTYLTLQERADKANKAQGDIFISIHTNSVDKKNRNRKSVAGSSVYTLGLHKDDSNLAVAMRENSVIELETDYEQKYSGFDPQRDESYIIFEMAQKKNLSQSIRFAEDVEKELVNIGRQDRGVHQAGFWVLWATSMPAVLVELDFICNPESAKYISSDKGAKELAEAIFKAVKRYEAGWNKNKVSNNGHESYFYEETSTANEYVSTADYVSVSTSEVATVKSRTQKKTAGQSPTKIRSGKNSASKASSNQRRRRSQRSKALSMNNDFEKDNLSVTSNKAVASVEPENSQEIYIAQENSVSDKKKAEKNKNKKKEKKQKTEKKASGKEKKQSKKGHDAKVNKLVTVYKIQILASADLLSQNNARFCGLSPISTFKENNLYKYYYGESTDKAELEALLPEVRRKIPDAFIVSSQKTISSNK